MSQDFDQYPGPPANYTEEMIRVDFPRTRSRPAGDGRKLKPGFISGRGWGRAYVGDEVLRVTHPLGAVHAMRRACAPVFPMLMSAAVQPS